MPPPSTRSTCDNSLLVWAGMTLGRALDCRALDLGPSDDDQPGLIRFKRQFGAEGGTALPPLRATGPGDERRPGAPSSGRAHGAPDTAGCARRGGSAGGRALIGSSREIAMRATPIVTTALRDRKPPARGIAPRAPPRAGRPRRARALPAALDRGGFSTSSPNVERPHAEPPRCREAPRGGTGAGPDYVFHLAAAPVIAGVTAGEADVVASNFLGT